MCGRPASPPASPIYSNAILGAAPPSVHAVHAAQSIAGGAGAGKAAFAGWEAALGGFPTGPAASTRAPPAKPPFFRLRFRLRHPHHATRTALLSRARGVGGREATGWRQVALWWGWPQWQDPSATLPAVQPRLSRPVVSVNNSPTTPQHSPDVLPPDVMDELARLQDKIKNFSTADARAMIEADLGASIDDLFSEFSAEPIAAASLAQVRRVGATQTDACDAEKRRVCGLGPTHPPLFPHLLRTQVYRARVRSTGQEVAVKVQRPGALSTISKVRI